MQDTSPTLCRCDELPDSPMSHELLLLHRGCACHMERHEQAVSAVVYMLSRPCLHASTGHLPSASNANSLCRLPLLRGPGRARRGALVIAMAAAEADGKITVTVTGAGGRTGKLVLKKLLAQPERYTARGLVRDEKVHGMAVGMGAQYQGGKV